MELKEIISDREALSDRAVEIDPRKEGKLVQEIVLALKKTMRANKLQSLSAPQIGYDKRIFCLRFGDNDYRTFVNPVISKANAMQLSRETCSSIPGKTFIRPRYGSVEVIYMTPMGKVESRSIMGRAATVFEHCVDHLDGLLLDDVGLEIDELFDNASDEEREEVINAYLESLDIRHKQLQDELQQDEETKDIINASKFMQSVQRGEVQIEKSEMPNTNLDKE